MAPELRIGRVGCIARERLRLKIESDQPTPLGPNPERAGWMLADCLDDVPELLGFIGDVLEIVGVVSRKLPRTRPRCAVAIKLRPPPYVPTQSTPEESSKRDQTRLWLRLWGSSGLCLYIVKL